MNHVFGLLPRGGAPAGGPPGGWGDLVKRTGMGGIVYVSSLGGAVGVVPSSSFVGRGSLQIGHLSDTDRSRVKQFIHR